jgi:nucleoside-diphosphate-sugar epimerase
MSLFEKAFGWIPSMPLKEGIAKTVDWYKNV